VAIADHDKAISSTEALTLFAGLKSAPALVLAVSGGPDSSALLVLAARWRKRLKRGPKLLAVTVDHGLRAEAKQEARAVARLARRLGVSHRTVYWRGAKPATGLPAAARVARYALLAKAARQVGAQHVVTAHTLDDQAETVLFRLARGSGVAGLAAMAPVTPLGDVFLVRPFLHVTKARLVATLAAENIAFAEDPSNVDPRFTRARLRALMPALAREGLDARRFALLARRVRRSEIAIEAVVDIAAARLSRATDRTHRAIVLDAEGFAVLPAEIALRLLGRAVTRVGDEGPVELGKLEQLFEALVAAASAARHKAARFRRTLAGAMVTHSDGLLTVEAAPPRRNRAKPAHIRGKDPFTKGR
jgi:tRNA(Ile)-lysidine synthase